MTVDITSPTTNIMADSSSFAMHQNSCSACFLMDWRVLLVRGEQG
jgi:hypothetical protein